MSKKCRVQPGRKNFLPDTALLELLTYVNRQKRDGH